MITTKCGLRLLAMDGELVEVCECSDSGVETDEDGVLDLEIDNDGVAGGPFPLILPSSRATSTG